MRRALGTTGSSGVLATLLAKGWIGVGFALAVVTVLTVAVCWVIADPDRPHRLALVLAALRGAPNGRRRPPRRR